MTNKFLKTTLFVSVIFILSGCTTLKEFLGMPNPSNDPFREELAGEYKILAQEEADQFDWMDSQHYINKGIYTIQGGSPLPENMDDWDIPTLNQAELARARSALMTARENDKVMNLYPKELAKAQAAFDCWMEQQEENWQHPHIEKCRHEYYKTMRVINMFLVEDPYIIYFALKSAEVQTQSMLKIKDIARRITALRLDYDLVLNGYTDTVDDAASNMKLAHARAVEVKRLLVENGVNPDKVHVFAFGESDLAVPTSDEVSEPMNRRVEVDVTLKK